VKRIPLVLALVLVVIQPSLAQTCNRQGGGEVSALIDASCVEALWATHIAAEAGVSVTFAPGVSIELPVSYIVDRSGGGEQLLELAIALKYHPWETGPFVGFTLAHACLFVGRWRPQEPNHFLNGMMFGYTFEVNDRYCVEPVLLFRDPSDSFTESWAYINALVPAYSRFRFRLRFSVKCFPFSMPQWE